MLYDIFAGIGIAHFETDAGSRDHLADFDVLFHNLNESFKGGVVDEIAIGFAALIYKHIKGVHQFLAIPAFGLTDSINAIGQTICLGKSELIADENISFGFLCRL